MKLSCCFDISMLKIPVFRSPCPTIHPHQEVKSILCIYLKLPLSWLSQKPWGIEQNRANFLTHAGSKYVKFDLETINLLWSQKPLLTERNKTKLLPLQGVKLQILEILILRSITMKVTWLGSICLKWYISW